MKTNQRLVEAFFRSHGIPEFKTEYKFHTVRKWRFDYAWPVLGTPNLEDGAQCGALALEVEGGVWSGGRHTSGSGFMKDMEKYNEAVCLGWKIIRCTPQQLLSHATAVMIMRALR